MLLQAYAALLDGLAKAVHLLPGRPSVSVDTESVAGACWDLGPPGHTWDQKPCPWIRRFWNFDALASSELDTVMTMDTYTRNTTELPYDLWLVQKYLPVSRLAFGLWPTQFNPPASSTFVASRMDAFESYGAGWISIWVINPGSPECPTMKDVEDRWAPWIPRLKQFLGSQRAVAGRG